jgi:glycosyltransferase involved in cell wall biosynthesis
MSENNKPDILCINTGGIGDLHGLRMRRLTTGLDANLTFHDVDKSRSRPENSRTIWALLNSRKWDLVYQEATGIASGSQLIRAARNHDQRYVVSTGDPVGNFFKTTRGPIHGAIFERYEKSLYRHCAGFIGWTPYLTGMALKMGARRAVTVEGAADLDVFRPYPVSERIEMKKRYGLNPDHIVCGVVGSLSWSDRQQYSYGLELVSMMQYLSRTDVSVLIIGDGTGRAKLEERVPPELKDRILFTGRVAENEVVDALNAMDIGFITQTLDGLGSFRLTTKLPEYLGAGLPVAMSPIPGYYDYALNAAWALPPFHPASDKMHRGTATWLDSLERTDIEQKRAATTDIALQRFSYEVVRPRFHQFITDILAG